MLGARAARGEQDRREQGRDDQPVYDARVEKPLEVGIIGTGTAGSTAALFLARQGHRVTLFEEVLAPSSIGAGIVLQPTGQSVLARLSLLAPILEHGARLDRLRCETTSKRTIVDLEYAMVDASLYGLGLHRGTLFTTLLEAVKREPNVTLRLGHEILALVTEGEKRRVRDARGELHGPFDLIVVANGAASSLENDRPLRRRVVPYAWGALWTLAGDPTQIYRGMLYQVVRQNEVMLGFLPTGRGPDDPTPTVSLYWSLRADRIDAFHADDLEKWKGEVRSYDPRSGFVLDAIDKPTDLLFARYRDVVMPRFTGHGCVYLGDAAHAMSPQLGQGANLALYDAMVLGDCVAGEPTVALALARYDRDRRAHLGFYQFATRWLTPFFQGDQRLFSLLRDVLMPVGAILPPVRAQMVRSMLGVKRGIVRSSFPLEPLKGLLAAHRS